MQGNGGTLKKLLLRLEQCRVTAGKVGGECKNTLLKPRIVQGNCMETGGKLKNTFFAKKSA